MTEKYWTKKQSQELFEKAIEFEAIGNTEEAIDCYQKSLQLFPKNAQSLYNLGIAFATLSKIDQAISCWRRAIWLEPRFRDELIKAFSIEDEISETIIGESYMSYELCKAA